MRRLIVLTPWVEVAHGIDSPAPSTTVPAVVVDYPLEMVGDIAEVCADITLQPVDNITPDPNIYCVEMLVSDAKAAMIAGDPKYYIISEDAA